MDAAPSIIGQRYRILSQLGAGGMGMVFCAVDRLTGERVALKRVSAPTEQLLFASRSQSIDLRLALAREFQSLASLRHPNIISVLDYGFDADRQPYFTMELVEQGQTLLDAGRGQPQSVQVGLLVQMLLALAYLHRRGIIHRDLKPGNVLVTGGQVKVLDFGLALTNDRDHAGLATGTLAYMAPELLHGESAEVRSDLYAMGIIAYELFAGRHPYNTESITQLVRDILETPPEVILSSIDAKMAPILERLLAKQPADRYENATQVIEALSAATGQALPLETIATRESFLRTAPLVGREAEIAQLTAALGQLIEKGAGSACLIGGESGIGKSRLMEELRTVAMVRGATVLRGQAVSDGSTPYQLWQNSVRRLILLADLSDFEVSVLKPLVPDIANLLERDVPDAPELDPKTAQTRLLSVIAGVVARQRQPAVLILEDLQWAGAESLELLSMLVQATSNSPLMIVGSYRDDERPDLPQTLGIGQVLKLQRLTSDHIAALGQSMLGEGGKHEHVVEILGRETEGNVFFLIEVVRTLAEEVGQLDKVASVTLPSHVLTGGTQRIVARRLAKVPGEARPLLHFAAVAGRQLDLTLLRSANGKADLEEWLDQCADAAVLDVQDGRWRFAHDKLRDGLLGELSAAQKRDLHRRVATGIEAVYPDPTAHLAHLAYHWGMAEEAGKEVHYAALAGAQALRNGANEEAIKFMERALELDMMLHVTPGSADKLRWARWERQLGEAFLGLGNLNECREHMQRVLKLLGQHEPVSRAGMAISLLKQVGLQFLHRRLPGRYIGRARAEAETLLEATLAYERIGELHYFARETLPTVHGGLSTLNLAERFEPSPALARAYANMSVVCSLIPLYSLAESYSRRAQETAAQVNERRALAFSLSRISVYSSGIGAWDRTEKALNQAVEIAEQIGDHRQWGESTSLLSLIYYYRGQFARSAETFARVNAAAKRTGDFQYRAWGLYWQAQGYLQLGQLDRALALLQETLPLLERTSNAADRIQAIITYGLFAQTHLQRGEFDQARQAAAEAVQYIVSASITSGSALEGYVGPVETYLALWEAGDQASSRLLQKPLKILHKYGRIFPIAQPRLLRCQGLADWLSSQPEKARKAWQDSRQSAEEKAMPLEKALAHYEIGRHLPKGDPGRADHLGRAREQFTGLGCAHHLEQVERALAD